ncbi:MAG: hypothetical protein HQK72_14920 [Desulfamplus sp.]|nr:hypothetical protein [Desulfamplus sp.]
MIHKLAARIKIAEAKKELLNFTVNVLKDDGVISDESFNRWRNIKSGSIFDGVNTMCDCWRYGLDWTPNIKWTKNNDLKLHLTSPFALSSLQ